jgi:hypothetical protein
MDHYARVNHQVHIAQIVWHYEIIMCELTTQMLVQGKGPFTHSFFPQIKIPKHTIMIVHVLNFLKMRFGVC